MKRLLVLQDPILAGHFHALLEESGISCLLRNHFLGGAAGELPPNECWPEIWVVHEHDADRARGIIEDARSSIEESTHWRCALCGEALEPQFMECWKCGNVRD